ncbi:hypothetical protein [Motilimonas eburnea]|uniref:hypothetical protein n=1 Tax=Motilimonas eburnea TaxID=1737488 RepID=UPI001E3F021C|nr:hypothetical protein [Motilimonas eburnea]MCE2573322.1 hypothetical protein [Motilimonas eburnea]
MKNCPFCAEPILDAAIKCKHCGEFLTPQEATSAPPHQAAQPWYVQKAVIIVCLLSIGPLALPMIWFHPTLAPRYKVLITLVTSLITWGLILATIKALSVLQEYYELINQL